MFKGQTTQHIEIMCDHSFVMKCVSNVIDKNPLNPYITTKNGMCLTFDEFQFDNKLILQHNKNH